MYVAEDLPEFQIHKTCIGLFTALTKAQPFGFSVKNAKCMLLIPLSPCTLSVIDRSSGKTENTETPYSLNFVPTDSHFHVTQNGAVEYLYQALDRAYIIKHSLEGLCKRTEGVKPVVGYKSPDISLIAQSLRFHLFADHPFASLFVEVLTNLLIVHVVAASKQRDEGSTNTKKLHQSCLTRILEHIETSLDQRICVSELAEISNMTANAFARAFRESVGQSPNRYIIERRINLARALLSQGDVPLADIAYSSGFSSQSHMTDAFRQKLGVTPGRYRRTALKG